MLLRSPLTELSENHLNTRRKRLSISDVVSEVKKANKSHTKISIHHRENIVHNLKYKLFPNEFKQILSCLTQTPGQPTTPRAKLIALIDEEHERSLPRNTLVYTESFFRTQATPDHSTFSRDDSVSILPTNSIDTPMMLSSTANTPYSSSITPMVDTQLALVKSFHEEIDENDEEEESLLLPPAAGVAEMSPELLTEAEVILTQLSESVSNDLSTEHVIASIQSHSATPIGEMKQLNDYFAQQLSQYQEEIAALRAEITRQREELHQREQLEQFYSDHRHERDTIELLSREEEKIAMRRQFRQQLIGEKLSEAMEIVERAYHEQQQERLSLVQQQQQQTAVMTTLAVQISEPLLSTPPPTLVDDTLPLQSHSQQEIIHLSYQTQQFYTPPSTRRHEPVPMPASAVKLSTRLLQEEWDDWLPIDRCSPPLSVETAVHRIRPIASYNFQSSSQSSEPSAFQSRIRLGNRRSAFSGPQPVPSFPGISSSSPSQEDDGMIMMAIDEPHFDDSPAMMSPPLLSVSPGEEAVQQLQEEESPSPQPKRKRRKRAPPKQRDNNPTRDELIRRVQTIESPVKVPQMARQANMVFVPIRVVERFVFDRDMRYLEQQQQYGDYSRSNPSKQRLSVSSSVSSSSSSSRRQREVSTPSSPEETEDTVIVAATVPAEETIDQDIPVETREEAMVTGEAEECPVVPQPVKRHRKKKSATVIASTATDATVAATVVSTEVTEPVPSKKRKKVSTTAPPLPVVVTEERESGNGSAAKLTQQRKKRPRVSEGTETEEAIEEGGKPVKNKRAKKAIPALPEEENGLMEVDASLPVPDPVKEPTVAAVNEKKPRGRKPSTAGESASSSSTARKRGRKPKKASLVDEEESNVSLLNGQSQPIEAIPDSDRGIDEAVPVSVRSKSPFHETTNCPQEEEEKDSSSPATHGYDTSMEHIIDTSSFSPEVSPVRQQSPEKRTAHLLEMDDSEITFTADRSHPNRQSTLSQSQSTLNLSSLSSSSHSNVFIPPQPRATTSASSSRQISSSSSSSAAVTTPTRTAQSAVLNNIRNIWPSSQQQQSSAIPNTQVSIPGSARSSQTTKSVFQLPKLKTLPKKK